MLKVLHGENCLLLVTECRFLNRSFRIRALVGIQTMLQFLVRIVKRGSSKPGLHDLALDIFNNITTNSVALHVTWIQRRQNVSADVLSRYVDPDDWGTTTRLFDLLTQVWGPFTVDRFASSYNRKCSRYFSKFFDIDCEGKDAFLYAWDNENNFLVPPTSEIVRVVKKIENAPDFVGTLIFPLWESADFWPLLKPGGEWWDKVSQVKIFRPGQAWVKQGRCPFTLIGSGRFKSDIVACRFTGSHAGLFTSEVTIHEAVHVT